jgi:hypothetical protein
VGEHLLERLEPRRQHLAHGVALGRNARGKLLGVLAEGFGDLVASGHDGVGDAGAGLFHLGDHVAAAQRQVQHQRVACGLQRRVDLVAAGGDRLGEPAGGVDQHVGELLGAVLHHLNDIHGLVGEALRHLVEAAFHHLREVGRELGELLGDVVGLEVEARGQAVACAGDGVRGFLAGAVQPLQQVAAALAEARDHAVAGAAERHGDVLALLGERACDLLRAFVDPLGNVLADRGNVVGQIEMHARDGVAHLLGLADQGVALMRQRLEQAADAHLIVVIGAFQRRDFVGDQGF